MSTPIIIATIAVFVLLVSIFFGLYALGIAFSTAGDVRRINNAAELRRNARAENKKKPGKTLQRLTAAGIEVKASTWYMLLVLLGIAGGMVGFLIMGLTGVLLIVVGPLLAELWVRSRAKSRKASFDEQLARALPMVAENMRGGASVERALRSVGQNSDDPLKTELLACSGSMQIDGDISVALEDMAERTGSHDVSLLQSAVASHKEVGGSLADSLERIGETIDARLELRRHVESETSSVMASMKALVVMAFIIFGIVLVGFPQANEFYFHNPAGIPVLLAVALLVGGGVFVIYKMADIDVD